MDENLRKSAIAGIVFAVMIVPRIVLEVLLYMNKLQGFYNIIYYAVVIITATTFGFFVWGFKIIGDKTKNKTLVVASYIIIAIEVLTAAKSLILVQNHPVARILLSVAFACLSGIAAIILGIGILKLKERFGNLAKTVGILNIIGGASLAVIIFFFIAIIVYIPWLGLEIALMFKAAERL